METTNPTFRSQHNCSRSAVSDTLFQVKLVGKFVVLLMALSVFASPLMACLLPDSTLTDEERECCRQMAGDCGDMPASHSCCKTVVKDSDPYLSTARTLISAPTHVTVAVLPIAVAVNIRRPISLLAPCLHGHAPPESPPSTTSILRI